MTMLPDLSAQIRRLREGCVGNERTPLDLRRNVAYWLAARAGLRPHLSSFHVEIADAPSAPSCYDSAPVLAALGFLLDLGGSPAVDGADLEAALERVVGRAAHTAEKTGYADDPLVLAGLTVLAKSLPQTTATGRLRQVALAREGALPITLALPFVAATGVRPRLVAVDDKNIAEIAAVVLAAHIPESASGDLLPANMIQAAPDRLVLEATLDRLSDSSDFGNLLVLAALEVMVGSVRQLRPAGIESVQRKEGAADLLFVVALNEEFRVLFDDLRTPEATERDGSIYYAFECADQRCQATLVGEPGTEPALMVTDRAITHWSPRAVLFVGIAGGIHSDVRVGDVVVASQIDLYMANTKAVESEGGFDLQHAGRAFHTDHTLLQRVRNVEFSHSAAFRSWQQGSCDQFQAVLPAGVAAVENVVRAQPALLNGHIASGPSVATSASFTEWLRSRDRKYLAVEMEGGGAAMASTSRPIPVPVLVIRGISDHADADKSTLDEVGEGAFRSYAMGNAVRFARQVLIPAGVFRR